MGILKKNYEVVKDAPKEMGWDEYFQIVMEEYHNLLTSKGNEEVAF